MIKLEKILEAYLHSFQIISMFLKVLFILYVLENIGKSFLANVYTT